MTMGTGLYLWLARGPVAIALIACSRRKPIRRAVGPFEHAAAAVYGGDGVKNGVAALRLGHPRPGGRMV